MSLPHALLTALCEKAGSGLDLARRFDKSFGFFWSATHQQIYRELGRLEDQGLIQSETVPSARGQKKIYQLLPPGYDELKRWVPLEDEPTPYRESILVRLRAEAALGPLELAPTLRRRLEVHRQNLAAYLEIEKRDFATSNGTRRTALQKLILTCGIRSEAGWIECLEGALAIIGDD